MGEKPGSIVIRNYNRSQSLQRAIASALAQTDQGFAILIIDDASTDDSLVRTQANYSHLPAQRLRVIAAPQDGGAGSTSAFSIAMMSGYQNF